MQSQKLLKILTAASVILFVTVIIFYFIKSAQRQQNRGGINFEDPYRNARVRFKASQHSVNDAPALSQASTRKHGATLQKTTKIANTTKAPVDTHEKTATASISSDRQELQQIAALGFGETEIYHYLWENDIAADNFDLQVYVTTVGGANLRESAAEEAKILQIVPYNEKCRALALEGAFARIILSDGTEGYIRSDLLSLYPQPVIELATDPENAKTTPQEADNSSDDTNPTENNDSSDDGDSSDNNNSSADGEDDKVPTKKPTEKQTPEASVDFFQGSDNISIQKNFDLISSLFHKSQNHRERHYSSFNLNQDGTITVDDVTFPYIEALNKAGTVYSGNYVKCGLAGQRGIVAVAADDTSLPYGSVVFIENYGLAVVGDGCGTKYLDLCYDSNEEMWDLLDNGIVQGVANYNVYILSRP